MSHVVNAATSHNTINIRPRIRRVGGNAKAFDWTILSNRSVPVPWFLAGGLTPDNVAEAVRVTGARTVDVSSGVEATRGVKSVALIRAFLERVRGIQ